MKRLVMFLFFVVVFSSFVSAGLEGSCVMQDVSSPCSNGWSEVENLYFSGTENGHVCYDEAGSCYPNKLCCQGEGMYFFKVALDSFEVISIYSEENSHVAEKNFYSTGIGFYGTDNTNGYCYLADVSCEPGDVGMFSLSGEENAHAGKKGFYDLQFCCVPVDEDVLDDEGVLYITSISGDSPVDEGQNAHVYVTVQEYVDPEGFQPVEDSTVEIKFLEGDSLFGSAITNEDGEVDISKQMDSEGSYTVYATATHDTLDDYLEDDERYTIIVNQASGPPPGEGPTGGGYQVWGDCICEDSDGCPDGIGTITIELFDQTGNPITPDRREDCFLTMEDVPFMNNFAFLIIILGLGIFYYSEIFKKRGVNKIIKR